MDYLIKDKHTNKIIAHILNPANTDILNGIITFRCYGMLVQFKEIDVKICSNNKIRPLEP